MISVAGARPVVRGGRFLLALAGHGSRIRSRISIGWLIGSPEAGECGGGPSA
jgi:hypothetical protein